MALLLDLYRNLKEKLVVGSLPPPRVVGHFITEKDREVFDMFEAWMVEYNKSYDSVAETEKRFEIFKENKREVERLNALSKPCTYVLNMTADLTHQEFLRMYASPPLVVLSAAEEDRQARVLFKAWMARFKKSYNSVAEKEKRFQIFKKYVREKGLCEFSDLTLQEYKQHVLARSSSVSAIDKQHALERYQLPIYYCI